ncbi:MAG: hypothetical protein IPJ31_15490 [Bacteroidetes bacterium]|nr:hypothetical protein [Bacteroidota bacterium]
MALLGHLINRSLIIRQKLSIITGTARLPDAGIKTITKAKNTHFGKYYHFGYIGETEKLYQTFKEKYLSQLQIKCMANGGSFARKEKKMFAGRARLSVLP